MSISTSLSFHGVSRIEISKPSRNNIGDKSWTSRTIWLYNQDDEECVSFSIHSREDGGLPIEMYDEEESRDE